MEKPSPPSGTTYQTLTDGAAQDRRCVQGLKIAAGLGLFMTGYTALKGKGVRWIAAVGAASAAAAYGAYFFQGRAAGKEEEAKRIAPFRGATFGELLREYGEEALKVHPDKEGLRARLLLLPYRELIGERNSLCEAVGLGQSEIERLVTLEADKLPVLDFMKRHGELPPFVDTQKFAARVREALNQLPVSEWGPYEQFEGIVALKELREWAEAIESGDNSQILTALRQRGCKPKLVKEGRILPRTYDKAREACLNRSYHLLCTIELLLGSCFGIDKEALKQKVNEECEGAPSFTAFVSRWGNSDKWDHFESLYAALTPENQKHLRKLFLEGPPAQEVPELVAKFGVTKREVLAAMKEVGYRKSGLYQRLGEHFKMDSVDLYGMLREAVKALPYSEFSAKHGLDWRKKHDPKATLDDDLREKLKSELKEADLIQLVTYRGDGKLLGVPLESYAEGAAERTLAAMQKAGELLTLPPYALEQKWVTRDHLKVRRLVVDYLKEVSTKKLLQKEDKTYEELLTTGLIPEAIKNRIEKLRTSYGQPWAQIQMCFQQMQAAKERPENRRLNEVGSGNHLLPELQRIEQEAATYLRELE
ncbi:MAG: hypothetical protein AB7F31_04545 [Parachlamydiales bacterium]